MTHLPPSSRGPGRAHPTRDGERTSHPYEYEPPPTRSRPTRIGRTPRPPPPPRVLCTKASGGVAASRTRYRAAAHSVACGPGILRAQTVSGIGSRGAPRSGLRV